MNTIKKIAALLLAVVSVLGLAACHKKDEVAVIVGEYEFTSAYYMCAFINADMEAQTEAYNIAMSGEQKGIDVTKDDYLYDVKIDGKKYETWVKDKALDTIKTVAAYKTLCKKYNLSISEADKLGAEAIIEQEWAQYGTIFEPNGVSKATYTKYRLDDYLSELYFDYLYVEDEKDDKKGSKAPSADEIKKHMNENYVLANVIGEDLSSLEDEQKTEKKNKINEYYAAITAGTKTFEAIYKEHYSVTEDSETTTETEESAPKDKYASLISKENGGDHFKSIMEMSKDEIKILNGENDSDILLVVKKDVNDDPYYLEEYDLTFRHELKDEEFKKEIEAFKKTLKLEEDTYATKQFKVKKIEYPTTTSY